MYPMARQTVKRKQDPAANIYLPRNTVPLLHETAAAVILVISTFIL